MILSRYSVLANLYLLLSSAHTLFSQKIIEVEYGGSEHEVGYTVIETSNRNILSAGITESLGENNDIYLVKTDLEGTLIWANNYGENK